MSLDVLAGADASDLGWFTPAGTAMTPADWSDGQARAIALYLDGSDAPDRAADGSLLVDDDFLVLVNAWWEPLGFTIPTCRAPQAAQPGPAAGGPAAGGPAAGGPAAGGQTWQIEIDSYDPTRAAAAPMLHAGDQLTVSPRSIAVLRSPLPTTP